MPIAVQKDTACFFEEPIHEFDSFFEPSNIVVDTACPAVFETTDFSFVSPDDFIISIAEKRRIEIDQIDRFFLQRLHNFQIVAQNEPVDWQR